MPKERSFLFRVRQSLPDLHPAEKRIGEFVCDFPGELASYSAQELAALAHVSKATVTRFIRRLGYENYEEARRHARAEKQTGSRFFLARAADAGARQSIQAHVAQAVVNLEATFLGISETQIDSAVTALLHARKVWVIGFRSSHPFAAYLQWQLTQVIENIAVIPGAGQTMGEHLVSVDENDVVIFFGLRRRTSQSDAIVDQVRRSKAQLLYVTDEGAPFETNATWHLQCQTLAPGPLFNHTAVMALCHLLITRCLEKAGTTGRARLRNIEALNETLDEL
ncbi:MurR/RpiR family transcriptional regulator [Agrobacterium sp. B1(2019)]|uniref:MurR/RpiR family transcriptional regulator n=1 Tax=Agrobacterium sp. B1(2019) TaxID=2607032 RepID=UPI0011EBAC02|nr:MurR/RpiR family transcriptional regulator [Agrobacterium sp. B1(2019)]TZG32152.1 MurR/RpiR family transcriptional regulator [Agrobacterium sp. B1(2019)]